MKISDKEWEVLKTFFLFQKGVSMQEDILILYNFTKNMGFNHVLELGIGVEANATKAFAYAKAQWLPSTSFTSVDFSEENLKISKKILEDFKLDKYVELIHSDSVEFLQKMPKNYYDCIFIDTSHSFEHTIAEIELSAEKFDPAGYIFLHDTCQMGVKNAIEYFLKKNPLFIHTEFNTPAGLGLLAKKSYEKQLREIWTLNYNSEQK
jgi:predicted O-methyltransferase YrrM